MTKYSRQATGLVAGLLLLCVSTLAFASDDRVDGYSAIEVSYSTGIFKQTGDASWTESNSDGLHHFRETGRDAWSIYLQRTDNIVGLQLDLWTREVKYSDNAGRNFVLYRITDARASSCPPEADPSFRRDANYGRTFGNRDIRSSFLFNSFVRGTDGERSASGADELEAKATLSGNVKFFRFQREIARAEARAYSTYGESAGGHVKAYAMGISIYSREWNANLNYNRNWRRNFFQAQQRFMIGPVPVVLTERAVGEVGFNVYGGPTTTGVGAGFEPYLQADAVGSVGVDVVVFGFGIMGELTLFRLGFPFDAELDLVGNELSASLDVAAEVESLSGRIKLWAQLLANTIREELTIISWNGFRRRFPILEQDWELVLCSDY